MGRNAREEDRMARLRKRAEMEPSDDEEDSGDQQSSGGGNGGDDWDDEEHNDPKDRTEPPNTEQVRVARSCRVRIGAKWWCISLMCVFVPSELRSITACRINSRGASQSKFSEAGVLEFYTRHS